MKESLFDASLFEETPSTSEIDIAEGAISLYHPLFSPDEADRLFLNLTQSLNWKQDEMVIAGKIIPIPRLQAWYGDPESHYGYSGISLPPLEWSEELLHIKQKIETVTQHRFNSVLANCYRDGSDSVAWHRDNEPELGRNPVIASLSLGETRQFQLRHKSRKYEMIKLNLPHNSLLLMAGETQHNWYHQVPKTKKAVGPRINLTFRLIQTQTDISST